MRTIFVSTPEFAVIPIEMLISQDEYCGVLQRMDLSVKT